jgi:integrase/recombinase XerD
MALSYLAEESVCHVSAGKVEILPVDGLFGSHPVEEVRRVSAGDARPPPGRWHTNLSPATGFLKTPARLGTIRIFAQWLHSMDAKHEVPPPSLIPSLARRPHPYIYSEDDIRRIVEAATELPSINGIRALTCSTLFGLIAVTGLRVSEALSLDAADIDLENGAITLLQGKLGKARLLPVSDCTRMHLADYAKERDRLLGEPSKAFFVSDRGERLTDCGARYSFAVVCQTIGLRPSQTFHRHGRGPRIHDLRHYAEFWTMPSRFVICSIVASSSTL